MITMTSLEAQNQFGLLLDYSQREPVTITRRGRPVAVVQSYQDAQTIPFHIAKLISETYPLRAEEAGKALRQTFKKIASEAERDGLTELDIGKIIHEG